MTKTHDVPETTLGDRLHTLAEAGIASIPVVGAAASELFTVILVPPLEKRRVERKVVANRVFQMEHQH